MPTCGITRTTFVPPGTPSSVVVAVLLPVDKQQLTIYMRFAAIGVGLLINFNVPVLRHGIRRILLQNP